MLERLAETTIIACGLFEQIALHERVAHGRVGFGPLVEIVLEEE